MSNHMYVEGRGGLHKLIPTSWFTNVEDSSIWLRLYSCVFVPHDQIAERVRGWLSEGDLLAHGGPILFGFGTFKDFKVPSTTMDLATAESGQLRMFVKVDEKALPSAPYIILAAPFRRDGADGDEPSTRRALDLAAGLIGVHAGANFMRECVFEGEVSGRDGRFSAPGPAHRIPQVVEGPFLAKENGLDIGEISKQLSKTSEPKRSRLELALVLMDTAMRKHEGFLEYWTALEVVCDGKARRIQDRLAKIYGLKSQHEAARVTGLGALTTWRDDYVHKGKRPFLTADVERYIQLVFLDLLRHELDLATRGHVAAIHHAVGYDLSSLGLPDNRTEAQKRAKAQAPESGPVTEQSAS